MTKHIMDFEHLSNGVRMARETLINSYSISQKQKFLSELKNFRISNTLPFWYTDFATKWLNTKKASFC